MQEQSSETVTVHMFSITAEEDFPVKGDKKQSSSNVSDQTKSQSKGFKGRIS